MENCLIILRNELRAAQMYSRIRASKVEKKQNEKLKNSRLDEKPLIILRNELRAAQMYSRIRASKVEKKQNEKLKNSRLDEKPKDIKLNKPFGVICF